MCRVFVEQLRNCAQYARHGTEWRIRFLEASNAVEMPEEFVGSVDKMNDHDGLFDLSDTKKHKRLT
jgi:hypothetical protein